MRPVEFNPRPLMGIPKGEQVGVLVLPAPVRQTQLYEFAAWWRQHEIAAGTYPVLVGHGMYPETGRTLFVNAPSVIVGANLRSHFGGVGYGKDTAGNSEIGKQDRYQLSVGSSYFNERALQLTHAWLFKHGGEFHWTHGDMKAAPIFND